MKLRAFFNPEFEANFTLSGGSDSNPEITGITANSNEVQKGYLFAALKGAAVDGAKFIPDALASGASAILTHRQAVIDNVDIPVLILDDPRRALALFAARFYGSQPETIVAITGTAGKTSIAAFVRQIWQASGYAAASIGTTGIVAPGRNEYGSLTTPDPVVLHALLKDLAQQGVSHASIEASSHGLDQHRLDGVRLAAGAFTNLSRDHMDYHPNVEHYFQSKMRLFKDLLPKGSPAIICSDDEWSQRCIDVALEAGHQVMTTGSNGTFLTLKRLELERFRQIAEIHFGKDIYRIEFPLAGDFQLSNGLVACGLAIATGVDPAEAIHALEKLEGAPGRLELVGYSKHHAPCYVDYAHKPEALEHVLSSLRPFTTGRIICVFGCGGDRDAGKRPIMGEIAARLSEIVIVTDDNPRTEIAAEIRTKIMSAAKGAREIGDREEAIFTAVKMLQKGDCLVVAGKGHEHGQIIGSQTYPFSDHEVVRRALAENGGQVCSAYAADASVAVSGASAPAGSGVEGA